MKFEINLENPKDVTDIIYDTLMQNKQFPQLKLEDVKDQKVDSSTGTIYLKLGKTNYQIKIIKE